MIHDQNALIAGRAMVSSFRFECVANHAKPFAPDIRFVIESLVKLPRTEEELLDLERAI